MDEDGPARNIAGTPTRLVHKKARTPPWRCVPYMQDIA